MCDYNPGQLIVAHDSNDGIANMELFAHRDEGMFPFESTEMKLDNLGAKPHPNLKRTLQLCTVPEGEELWWSANLTNHYLSRASAGPVEFRSAFAVSPNYHLMPCALTFTFGPNHSTYCQLMDESSSTGNGDNIRIKVLDTGLSTTSTIIPIKTLNTSGSTRHNDIEDQEGHGTTVCEIIRRLAPNAEFLVYKVKGTGPVLEWDVLAALCDYEAADIINCSFAFGLNDAYCPNCGRASHSARSAVFEGIIQQLQLIDSNTIIVAAAGNMGLPSLSYPSKFNSVVAVGSVDSLANISPSSNYGSRDSKNRPHRNLFFAPGGSAIEQVGETNPGTTIFHGTSFSAAYASGLIAKIKSEGSSSRPATAVLSELKSRANKKKSMANYTPADHGNGLLQL